MRRSRRDAAEQDGHRARSDPPPVLVAREPLTEQVRPDGFQNQVGSRNYHAVIRPDPLEGG